MVAARRIRDIPISFIATITLVCVLIIAAIAITREALKTEVNINGAVYHVAVAVSPDTRYKGLSGVQSLGGDGGLLMVYPTDGLHGIVMRGMKVHLDIMWLDQTKTVIHVVKDASPETGEDLVYVPPKEARYVMEVPAGSTTERGIKAGDKATFKITGAVR